MTTIWGGLSDGALYALAGIVFALPLVRCGLINFAQTYYIVLGNYLVFDMTNSHWSWVLMLVLLGAVGGVLGGVQEILTVRPTKGRHETALVTTVGVGIAVSGVILAHWGATPGVVPFFGGNNPFTLLGGRLAPDDLVLIILALVVAVGFHLAVGYTRWGLLGRASMADGTVAMLRGLNIPRLRTSAFILASALSCSLALFAAPKMGASLDPALNLALFAFAAAAIGGFGSFAGTAFGGFFIGIVGAFAARYLGADWVDIVIFGILAGLLVLRPQGLFGAPQVRVI